MKEKVITNILFSYAGTILGFVITLIIFPPGGENNLENWHMYIVLPPLFAAIFVGFKTNVSKNFFIELVIALTITITVAYSYLFLIDSKVIPFLFGVDLFIYIGLSTAILKSLIDRLVIESIRRMRHKK